jgi:hypothetical protein
MLTAERVSDIRAGRWFREATSPYLIVDTGLRIRAVNRAYERVTGRGRVGLIGAKMFDVFPDNPADPTADGVARLRESFESVFRSGCRDWMGVQHYDIPDTVESGRFVHKMWVPVNTPVGQGGAIVGALHHVEDVTTVFTSDDGRPAISLADLRADAEDFCGQFPGLTFEAVLGVLAHSHAVVIEAGGVADTERAHRLTRLRLELLAGHPCRDARTSSIR